MSPSSQDSRPTLSGLLRKLQSAAAGFMIVQMFFCLAGGLARASPVADVKIGGTVVISVECGGTEPFSYQWQKNGADITGATMATHTIPNAQLNDAGSYSVVVSNHVGSCVSDIAEIGVYDPITFNQRALQSQADRDAGVDVPLFSGWERGLLLVLLAGVGLVFLRRSHSGNLSHE